MTVRFASVNDIKEFVGLATLQPYPVCLLDGERTVNAKSFMEMFTLNFAQPLRVSLETEENEVSFALCAKKFLSES